MSGSENAPRGRLTASPHERLRSRVSHRRPRSRPDMRSSPRLHYGPSSPYSACSESLSLTMRSQ
eukprot:scaffold60059_cov42-Phaeocystis_antarctica.AAC.1